MRIKRFSAPALSIVVERIKAEFGLKAVILSQREDPETGAVEVTAGVREEDLPKIPLNPAAEESREAQRPPAKALKPATRLTPKGAGVMAYRQALGQKDRKELDPAKDLDPALDPILPKAPPKSPSFSLDDVRAAIGEGIGEIRELILDLAHRRNLAEKWRDRADLVALYRKLLNTSMDPELARDLTEKAALSQLDEGGDVISSLRRTVRPLIKLQTSSWPKALAVTGPSGAGKTTALVKLAALAIKKGLTASAITLDDLKLGAAGQLAQYARILGLGIKACQTRAEFDEAREIFEGTDLLLVDTSTRDFQAKGEKAILAGSGVKNLLVLPASLKTEDLFASYANAFSPDLWGVALSKLDETKTLGGPVAFAIKAGPKFGFFSDGPKIPEDFMAASPDRLLDQWLASHSEEGF
jgi:flagellar biosynthesis protein FlhF